MFTQTLLIRNYITIYSLELRFKQLSLQLKWIQNKNFMNLLESVASHNILNTNYLY